MKNKKRILLLAVVLGVALGAGIALLRERQVEGGRLKVEQSNAVQTAAAPVVTNVAQAVAVTNVAQAVAVTNVAASVQPSKPPKLPKLPAPPVSYLPNVPKARQVLLANRRIVVEEGRSFPKEFCAAQTPTARGTAPYVVISAEPVSREVRIQAAANGAKVIGFLPNNALLVEADAAALKNLEEDAGFLAAVEYEPADKVQRRVREETGEKVEATIVLLNPADRETVRKFVTENGGTVIAGTPSEGKAIMAEIPAALVDELAKKAEVKWIEKYGRLKLSNDQAVLPQVLNVTPVWNTHGLTGEGQVIATMDSGIDNGSMTDINADFAGQIVEIAQFSSGDYKDYTGHGTHTAGSLVGLGANSSGQFKGVAHGAKLLVQSASSKEHTFSPYREDESEYFIYKRKEWGYGVRSDSWGAGESVGYDYYCELCDDCIWNDPELLDVLAAGNDGGGYSPDGSIDSPASAKNVLAVGSTGNRRFYTIDQPNDNEIKHLSSYSSLGPTADGRVKPDVCAPGEYVVSVASRNAIYGAYFDTAEKYAYNSGTSMATPLAAGCAALVREWLMKRCGYGETKPTAALMKAILTGGAYDIYDKNDLWSHVERPAPSNMQGWGRINLGESIFPTGGLGVYLKDRLPFKTGTNFVFTVTTTNAASLRAQLVWIDHAAEQLSGPMINNNLDLTVSSAGSTWYGNGGTAPDEVNTVESVRIENAAAAAYTVTVSCPTIPYDHTEGGAAAIYIRGAFDPATVQMLGGNDLVPPYRGTVATDVDWTKASWEDSSVPPKSVEAKDWNKQVDANLTFAGGTATITADRTLALGTLRVANTGTCLTIANGANTISAQAFNDSASTGQTVVAFPTAAGVTAGADTVLNAANSCAIAIASGKKLTVKGGTVTAAANQLAGALTLETGATINVTTSGTPTAQSYTVTTGTFTNNGTVQLNGATLPTQDYELSGNKIVKVAPPVAVRHMPYRLSFNGVNSSGCAMVNDSDDAAKGSVAVTQLVSGYRNYNADAKDGYSHQVNSGTMQVVANEANGEMLASGQDGYVIAFWMKNYGENAWKDDLGVRIGKVANFGFECCDNSSYSIYAGDGEPVIYTAAQARGDYVLPIKKGAWAHVAIRVPPVSGTPVVYVDGVRICEFYTATSTPYKFDIGDRNLYQVLFGAARAGTTATGGARNMGNGNVRFDELAIYTGDFTEEEMAWFATQSIARLPPDPEERMAMMYFNRLAGGEKVPGGAYGDKIVVPGCGYLATHFAARTKIDNGAAAPARGGSYTDIIKKVSNDTDLKTHTVAGWFRVDALPASGEDNAAALYLARAHNGDHGGYKAAVDSTGAILVGKINNVGWNKEDGSSVLKSAGGQVQAGKWHHIGVAVTKSATARTATVRVFVNGAEIAMSSGYIKTNLNGGDCSYFEMGAGMSVAGVYVDNGALSEEVQFVKLATNGTYLACPSLLFYIARQP